jgi:hypothetical protein
VVIFGDVDPRSGWLSSTQIGMLVEFVGTHGGGFGLLAGERWTPQRFLGMPLEKLIPIRIDPSFLGRHDSVLSSGFSPRFTSEGLDSGIFRFSPDRAENERLLHSLPPLYWFARTLGPKPGASVLMEHPTQRYGAGLMPLVVMGRFGAGRIFFQGTDDTWRWRRHRGELLHDAYWVHVVRELMPSTTAGTGRRLTIRTDRRAYDYGGRIRAQLEVHDTELLAELGDETALAVTQAVETTEDTAAAVLERFAVRRIGPDANVFEGTWVAPRPGTFALTAADAPSLPDERRIPAVVRIDPPNLESRRPDADHELLSRLAQGTGGRVIELNELEAAFGDIRDRSVQIPDDLVEPLWDSKLALGVFALLLLIEWVGRKACDLL